MCVCVWCLLCRHLIDSIKCKNAIVLISSHSLSLSLSLSDAGAIYGGRDLSSRGVQIRNNYFHHINHLSLCNAETSCIRAAIYVDDFQGGVTVTGNIFYRLFTSFFSNQGR